MKLWMVMRYLGYEGDEFIGVFSTEELAKEAAAKHRGARSYRYESDYDIDPVLVDELYRN
jgi:hypothetical protein